MLESTTFLHLAYKNLGKDYDKKSINDPIKESSDIEYEINLRLYQLLEDSSYLETAYSQIQEESLVMQEFLKEKFLKLRIPKAIVEEYHKVFKK
tara:strand:+ start:635 stop:916 length:282 start_codon:yes stop_codon:yes gene_type:complete